MAPPVDEVPELLQDHAAHASKCLMQCEIRGRSIQPHVICWEQTVTHGNVTFSSRPEKTMLDVTQHHRDVLNGTFAAGSVAQAKAVLLLAGWCRFT